MPIYHIRPDRRPSGWQILSLAGVPFFVEASFLFFVGVVVLLQIQATQNIPQAGLFGFIIFFSLLAHEGGHALAARLFGYRDVSVSLVAFGGYTRHPAATRGHSLVITLAGPAVTILLATAAWIMAGMPLHWLPFVDSQTYLGSPAPWMQHEGVTFIVGNIFLLNMFWAIFNLLPVLPMDGGNAVLALLSWLMHYTRAMLYAALISLVTCAGLAVLIFSGHLGPVRGLILLIYFLVTFAAQNFQTVRDLWPRR